MTNPNIVQDTLVIERVIPHSPEKIWRALTQAPLIEEWLMRNDFAPVVGHRFNFRTEPMAHWNGVVDCEVLAVEPNQRLSYAWNTSTAHAETALPLKTIVTFTLVPTSGGTLLRMEQSGFLSQDAGNYRGASYGWQKFLVGLERVVERLA
jgi:uncharacterized protein YndB with AHSA1/START domain